jgi:cytochrome bd-type quinol oxidase subunit 2
MIDSTTAASIFGFLATVAMLFQLALALGAPWGEMAMGGKFPGRFSPKLRISALMQLVLLALMALVVLTRAGLVFSELFELSKSAIWFVVALCVVSAILNTITPSKKERMLWSPVTIILVICAVIVARS